MAPVTLWGQPEGDVRHTGTGKHPHDDDRFATASGGHRLAAPQTHSGLEFVDLSPKWSPGNTSVGTIIIEKSMAIVPTKHYPVDSEERRAYDEAMRVKSMERTAPGVGQV